MNIRSSIHPQSSSIIFAIHLVNFYHSSLFHFWRCTQTRMKFLLLKRFIFQQFIFKLLSTPKDIDSL